MKRILSVFLSVIMVISLFTVNVYAVDKDDTWVFIKQTAKDWCTYAAATNMIRRKMVIEGNNNWNSITDTNVRNASRASGGGMSNIFSYAGYSIKSQWFADYSTETKINKLNELLNKHPEGVVIYTFGGKCMHAILALENAGGTIYAADSANGLPSGRIPLTSAQFNGSSQKERIGWIKKVWYIDNGTCTVTEPVETPPPSHKHSWSYHTEKAHPHTSYKTCSCGNKEYMESKTLEANCERCFPLGNVNVTRSFDRITGETTFYSNYINNAHSISLKILRASSQYGQYNTYTTVNMSSTSYNITLPQGYYYKAVLTAKNLNTSQTRESVCDSFRIYNTYAVTYNANGGKNAPGSQIKIQDSPLTLSNSVPQRTGYIFKGWASSKTATDEQYKSGSTYYKNAKITLYAVWEPEVYTVKFDAGEARGELNDITVTYGNTIRMPNSVVRENYYLKGWAKQKNANTPDYKLGIDYMITSNQTLYPVWGNSTWDGDVSDKFAGGSGTKEDPYQISNAAELAYLASIVNSATSKVEYKYYKLTDNINLANYEWVPIGVYSNENQTFTGYFDGNGYNISDIGISEPNEGYVGLFGHITESTIDNVTIAGSIENINSSSAIRIGAVTGYALYSDILNCTALYENISNISTSASEWSCVGCIVGRMYKGSIINTKANNCYIQLKSGKFEAGIIGGSIDADLSDCSVTATDDELFGTGSEISAIRLGGIAGYLKGNIVKSTVNAAYFSGTLKSGTDTYVGGLIGELSGKVNLCTVKFSNGLEKNIDNGKYETSFYSSGKGNVSIGGIVGYSDEYSKLSDCKYDGQSISGTTTSGSAAVGGIIGKSKALTQETVSVKGGRSLSYADLPKKDGYKSVWYTEPEFKNKYDFSNIVTGDVTLYAKWENGDAALDIWDGTSKEPYYDLTSKTYKITNAEELAWISDVSNGIVTSGNNIPDNKEFSGYTIEIQNDIYINDTSYLKNWSTAPPSNKFNSISRYRSFKGVFDGNNYTIYGLYSVAGDDDYAGLIYEIDKNGAVKNLTLKDGFVSGRYAGGITGYNYGSVEKCNNENVTVIGDSYVGGIAGSNNGNISYCSNSGYVKQRNNKFYGVDCGGIAGMNRGSITRSFNSGNVYVSYSKSQGGDMTMAGGIAGAGDGCSISNCYNTGYIKGAYACGGIFGGYSYYMGESYKSAEIYACYNLGDVNAGCQAGGIAGNLICNNSSVINCYNTGNVSSMSSSSDHSRGSAGIAGVIWAYYKYGDSDYKNQNVKITGCYKGNTSDTVLIDGNCRGTVNTSMYGNKSSLSSMDSSYYGFNSSLNGSNPYLKALEETYKKYTVTTVLESDNSLIDRSFANVNGIVFANASNGGMTGGIIGNGVSDGKASSVSKNLLAYADRVSSITTSGNSKGGSGDIIGFDSNNAFSFNNVFSYSSMDLSAVNASNNTSYPLYQISSQRTLSQIKRVNFLNSVFGPDTYHSIDYLKENNKAVWVVKDNQLPELYYNCLNDIIVSNSIENGKIFLSKTEAVNGEIVEVTSLPDKNYHLNKIYVNGKEVMGTAFEVDGNSEVFATFAENTPEYIVSVENSLNASAVLANLDSKNEVSLMGESDKLIANDGDEIKIFATTDANYNLDAIFVNNEEIAGDSFVIDSNSNVFLKVSNLETEIKAVTNDAAYIEPYFATLSGTVSGDENSVKYISYWEKENPEDVYVTDLESGSGDYSVTVNVKPNTTYCFKMAENGDVKEFTTYKADVADSEDQTQEENQPITATSVKELTSSYKFNIASDRELTTDIILVAVYSKENDLICVKLTTFDGDTEGYVTVPKDSKISYAKVFVWSDNYSPLGVPEVVYL